MDNSQESLQSRQGVLFFLTVNQMMLSTMNIVMTFPEERYEQSKTPAAAACSVRRAAAITSNLSEHKSYMVATMNCLCSCVCKHNS
jgi:hypothetical protein